ncbi:MAG: 50S ribosomal protein L10 [Bacillota bacterium]
MTTREANRKAKEKMKEEIKEALTKAELVVVTDYRGLNVHKINDLRGQLRNEDCQFRVTKNTINRWACREAGYQALEELFEGPTAIAYAEGDPVAAAKIFNEFTRENESLVIKGGMLSGMMVNPGRIKDLGEIPSREVLLSKVVGGVQAPLSGLAGALSGTLRQLVGTIDAVRQQKDSA